VRYAARRQLHGGEWAASSGSSTTTHRQLFHNRPARFCRAASIAQHPSPVPSRSAPTPPNIGTPRRSKIHDNRPPNRCPQPTRTKLTALTPVRVLWDGSMGRRPPHRTKESPAPELRPVNREEKNRALDPGPLTTWTVCIIQLPEPPPRPSGHFHHPQPAGRLQRKNRTRREDHRPGKTADDHPAANDSSSREEGAPRPGAASLSWLPQQTKTITPPSRIRRSAPLRPSLRPVIRPRRLSSGNLVPVGPSRASTETADSTASRNPNLQAGSSRTPPIFGQHPARVRAGAVRRGLLARPNKSPFRCCGLTPVAHTGGTRNIAAVSPVQTRRVHERWPTPPRAYETHTAGPAKGRAPYAHQLRQRRLTDAQAHRQGEGRSSPLDQILHGRQLCLKGPTWSDVAPAEPSLVINGDKVFAAGGLHTNGSIPENERSGGSGGHRQFRWCSTRWQTTMMGRREARQGHLDFRALGHPRRKTPTSTSFAEAGPATKRASQNRPRVPPCSQQSPLQ